MYEELTLVDYMNQPIVSLRKHPDFSEIAFHVAVLLAGMTTSELLAKFGKDINHDTLGEKNG